MQIWAKDYLAFVSGVPAGGGVYSDGHFRGALAYSMLPPSQKLMCFAGKPHPPAAPSKVKQTHKPNFNPSSGAVQAAYKDTEMIIRET